MFQFLARKVRLKPGLTRTYSSYGTMFRNSSFSNFLSLSICNNIALLRFYFEINRMISLTPDIFESKDNVDDIEDILNKWTI